MRFSPERQFGEPFFFPLAAIFSFNYIAGRPAFCPRLLRTIAASNAPLIPPLPVSNVAPQGHTQSCFRGGTPIYVLTLVLEANQPPNPPPTSLRPVGSTPLQHCTLPSVPLRIFPIPWNMCAQFSVSFPPLSSGATRLCPSVFFPEASRIPGVPFALRKS